MSSVASVLTTVNAPYGEQLDGAALACCLKDASLAQSHSGHMSCFFGEISPEEQKAFAAHFDVAEEVLVAASQAFANYSGESYPLAA